MKLFPGGQISANRRKEIYQRAQVGIDLSEQGHLAYPTGQPKERINGWSHHTIFSSDENDYEIQKTVIKSVFLLSTHFWPIFHSYC